MASSSAADRCPVLLVGFCVARHEEWQLQAGGSPAPDGDLAAPGALGNRFAELGRPGLGRGGEGARLISSARHDIGRTADRACAEFPGLLIVIIVSDDGRAEEHRGETGSAGTWVRMRSSAHDDRTGEGLGEATGKSPSKKDVPPVKQPRSGDSRSSHRILADDSFPELRPAMAVVRDVSLSFDVRVGAITSLPLVA